MTFFAMASHDKSSKGNERYRRAFKSRKDARKDEQAKAQAQQWFRENLERLGPLGTNRYLRRYLFEPFNSLLDSFGDTTEEQVKRTITKSR